MDPWHEQDDFWESFYPTMFSQERMEAAVSDVDHLLTRMDLPEGSAVLDLACGPGRHALELARRGFRVTGVDRTTAYLERAQEQANQEGLAIEWIQADMRDFSRPNAFDAAINMFTAFGYFEDPAEDRIVVDNVLRSLRSSGVFLMELMGKERLARIFRERDWHEEPDGTLVLEERRIRPGWDWIENRWILLKGETRKEFEVSHRVYSAVELSSLLTDSGFTSVEVYGSLEGTPYDQNAKRLVIVAHK
jgi:SAM-dependent methyltransferase